MGNKKLYTYGALFVASGVVLSVGFTNCSAPSSNSGAINASSSASNVGSIAGKISVSVADSSGAVVYSDASVASAASFKMTAGKNYRLSLSQANAQEGTTYQLELTQTNVVSGSKQVIPLQIGGNDISVPSQGDYALKIVATPPSGVASSASYIASVACANPNFTVDSLNANAISVSAGSAANLFNLSASGLTSGANGTAPYSCAWDPTGTGIQDTAFKDCGQSLSNFYSNFLGARKVNVLVKDACNTVVNVSKTLTFNSAEPSMPGNVFISGVVTNAAGSAKGDSRIDGLKYLATNAGGNNIVQPSYGSGNFQIYSLMNYGMPSSVQFGLVLKLKGLTDNLNVSSGSGTVSAANAKIASLQLVTDQAGDSNPSVSLSGSNCTLSNQGAKVLFISGSPCSQGLSGDNNAATVEVYGHYSCSGVSATGASIDIQGNFDGYTRISDNCSGGGGGGGGVAPIKL